MIVRIAAHMLMGIVMRMLMIDLKADEKGRHDEAPAIAMLCTFPTLLCSSTANHRVRVRNWGRVRVRNWGRVRVRNWGRVRVRNWGRVRVRNWGRVRFGVRNWGRG
jgi:hypothetical protein